MSLQEDALPGCGLLECLNNWTCEIWARLKSIGTFPTNATGKCGARPCHFCGGPECMCQCSYMIWSLSTP